MEKRTGFKMGDNELTLLGHEMKVGDSAPDFTLVKTDLSPFGLSDVKGKVVIIAAVPSLDTKVCELETIRFNEEADKLGDQVAVLTISMDLPFAQERFCGAEGISNLTVLSDYQKREFGEKYGCLIDGLFLLNRSIFVIDQEGKVSYVQYLEQNTEHPDYDKALEAVRALL